MVYLHISSSKISSFRIGRGRDHIGTNEAVDTVVQAYHPLHERVHVLLFCGRVVFLIDIK